MLSLNHWQIGQNLPKVGSISSPAVVTGRPQQSLRKSSHNPITMAPPKRERDLRNEVNTYMLMGAAGLSPSSAKWLLKQEGLNELLHFLARATPKTVRSLFDRVRKEALEDIEGPPKKTPQKRVAAEFGDASCAKKARLQGVQQLGKILSQNPENQVSCVEVLQEDCETEYKTR